MPRAIHISEYSDIIYNNDTNKGIDKAIQTAFDQAKEAETRVRVEIRVTPTGTRTSEQCGQFNATPEHTDINTVKRAIVDNLNNTPGPTFEGQIRINFKLSGTGDHITSFTRTVKIGYYDSPGFDSDATDALFTGEGEETPGNTVDLMGDLNEAARNGGQLPPLMRQYLTMLMADAQDQRTQVQTVMGFLHRQNAMMMTMFDRAMRGVENYTLRFGFPQGHGPGISEVAKEPSGGGMGLLPQLLSAAANLAQQNNSPGAPAGGGAPGIPHAGGANRMNAIRHAGQQVSQHRGPMRGPRPGYGEAPRPGDPNDMGMDHYREEATRGLLGDEGVHGHDDESYGGDPGYDGEGGMIPHDPGPEGPLPGSGGAPNLQGLDADEMMSVIGDWLEADPSRKSEVMERLPQLTNLLS
jgi:hypothetical protein